MNRKLILAASLGTAALIGGMLAVPTTPAPAESESVADAILDGGPEPPDGGSVEAVPYSSKPFGPAEIIEP